MKLYPFLTCVFLSMALVPMTDVMATEVAHDSVKSPGGLALTAFDRVGARQVGGYFDTEWQSGESADSFIAHRFVLDVSSQVHPRILVNAELEFEYGGDPSNSGEIKIEQAWVDYKINTVATVRTGIVVVPFGRINVLHDSDVRELTDRSLYARYILPTTWSDTGIGVHGNFDVSDEAVMDYSVYVLNGLSGTTNATTGIRGMRPNFKTDNNKNKAIVTRVGYSPFLGLNTGVSLYNGKYDADEKLNLNMLGFDVAWKSGPFYAVSEWAQVNADASASNPTAMNGFYLEGGYTFFPDFFKNTFLDEDFANPTFTLFGRYGQASLDTSSTAAASNPKRTTVGMNYRPTATTVFKLEYQMNESAENVMLGSVAVGF